MSQGPPIPSYIFRGHGSAIHALHFFPGNGLFVSGDSDGWIVIWSIATKRPVAVWKGHDGGIMGLKDWQADKLISHGRDHELRVWQLRLDDQDGFSVKLPVDGADPMEAKQPWLLHSLSVNALNYCAFSICNGNGESEVSGGEHRPSLRSLFLAAPNGLDAGGIDIFQLPSEHRVCKLSSDKETQTGMVMAVSVFRHPTNRALTLASGYETGHVLLHINKGTEREWNWVKTAVHQPHSQPVLSLDVNSSGQHVFSSSADAMIAKIEIESGKLEKQVSTKHAGQQDLKIRDDGKIFATAGWDKRLRVYSCKTLKELAVLKWHQEGCYAVSFAGMLNQADMGTANTEDKALARQNVDLLKDRQANKVKHVHWLIGGGKDGKISLWDIY